MHPPIVLLISTDPHTGLLLEQVLDHRRATILFVETTEEGLRILKDQADLSLVLCDESHGQIASQIVLSQARRTAHNLPVIILGTDGSAKAAVEALHRGATDYLAQPVTTKGSPDCHPQHPRLRCPRAPSASRPALSIQSNREPVASDGTAETSGSRSRPN